MLYIGLDDETLLITGHWIEVANLDVMAGAITPAQASGTINYSPASSLCTSMVPWDWTWCDMTAGQYVINSKPEILEQHLRCLQIDAIWVFLEKEVSSSLLEIDLILDFDRGNEGVKEVLLELGVEVFVRVGERLGRINRAANILNF